MRWEPQRVLFLPCLLIPGRALSGQCLHPLSPGGDLKTTPRNVTGYLPCPGGVLLGFCSLFIGQLAVLLIHQRSSSRALPLQTPCDLTASLRPSLTSRWRTFWRGGLSGLASRRVLPPVDSGVLKARCSPCLLPQKLPCLRLEDTARCGCVLTLLTP